MKQVPLQRKVDLNLFVVWFRLAKPALFRCNEDCWFVQRKYRANKFKSNLRFISTWFMHQSIETTAPRPPRLTWECGISTVLHLDFSPAPRVKLDCYTLMAPVYTLKILLNRFHGNYSFRIAQKIVPSVAKTLACSAESGKSGRKFAMTYVLIAKFILKLRDVRQWLHCYDNVLISSSWGAQFERRDLYCRYFSSQTLLELNERIVRDTYWCRHFYTLCDSLFIFW